MDTKGPAGRRGRRTLALFGTLLLVATAAVPLAVGSLLGSGTVDAASSATNSASYAFGEGDFGQLGNGCSPCVGTPVNASPVGVTQPSGVHYTTMASGALHTVAVGSDGNVYAWGANDFGQLGNGTTTLSSTPQRVSLPSGKTYTQLAAGRAFSLALASTGQLYAWGANFYGQLGIGSTTASPTPVAVNEPTGVTFSEIAAGADFAVALGSDHRVYSWGANNLGQLGNGTETRIPVLTPQPLSLPLSAGATVKQLTAGSGHALALSSDGSAYAWGDNSSGELGNGSFVDSATPVRVAAPAGVTYTAIAAGSAFSEAITGSGSVEEWGANDFGQLGETSADNCSNEGPNPATNECSDVPIGVEGIPPLVPVTSIAAGHAQAYAVNAGGQLFAWGGNEYGEMGIGDTTHSSVLVPAKVALPPGTAVNVAQIFSGSQSSFAVAVTGADQQISIPTVGQKTYGDTDFNLGATASSGLPVSLTSDTPVICHGGGDVVNILGAGTCTLAVTQDGSNIWNPASVNESFTVNKAPLTLRASNETVPKGSTPSFGYTLSGFVRGDTAATAGVTGTPACSTPATPSSPPGKYPITCSVGSLSAPNYFFATFVGATLTITGAASASGYHMVGTDGGIFSFGGSGFFGSTGGIHLNQPIVGMASTPDGKGYWMVAADGGIFAFGDAAFYGSTGAIHLNKPVVGMAPTPDGRGYWLVASDGGIFSFGDAAFYGSTGAIQLNKPVVAMASSPDGKGYWLVASDGGIFSFGDAPFLGSTGALTLNQPIVGMQSSSSNGYWMVAADGGIFSFGDAPFYGSTAGTALGARVVGMLRNPDGPGYWIATAAGGVYAFGCPQFGSLLAIPLNAPIVGIG